MTIGPIRLPANQPQRFYRGGANIYRFRGAPVPPGDLHEPEDWVASVTSLFAESGDGLTKLADGTTLADAIAADPEGWLGAAHVQAFGPDPNLLVKLLDAGEPLPVHAHPTREFARAHLHSGHGKTESWLVVESDPSKDGAVYLGNASPIAPACLAQLVRDQDEATLLSLLNRIPVQAGDTLLVPSSEIHVIGAGVFVIEVQEPTDWSVMLTQDRFGFDAHEAYLGLGPDLALTCIDHDTLGADRIAQLRGRLDADGDAVRPVLPPEAEQFFRAERLDTARAGAHLEQGYAVVVVLSGSGRLTPEHAAAMSVAAGDVLLVPWSAGASQAEGEFFAIVARPPAPPARL